MTNVGNYSKQGKYKHFQRLKGTFLNRWYFNQENFRMGSIKDKTDPN